MKMRITTVAAAALLVVLAGYGIAGASVVTISIEPTLTQISANGLNGPATTTYKVYATVTGNTFTNSVENETLYGGLALYLCGVDYTYTGTALAIGKGGTGATQNATTNLTGTPWGSLGSQKGSLVNSSHAITVDGTGGVINTAASSGLFTNGDEYLSWNDGPAGFQYGNTDAPGGVKVLLYTGTIRAASGDGKVTVTSTATLDTLRVYTLGGDNLLKTLAPTTIINGSANINIGAAVSNEPPTIDSVSKSQITESDWDIHGQQLYNGPAHSIDVSAVGADQDAGTTLTYRWKMTKPGVAPLTLGETGAVLHMTIADIASLGLPVWKVDTNMWSLSVEAFDGIAYSAPTIIPTFVPEPATMGLLAFGVVGLLKRRRRA